MMERANGWQRAYYIYVWHPLALALAVSMPVCVSVCQYVYRLTAVPGGVCGRWRYREPYLTISLFPIPSQFLPLISKQS
ncbi:hypothetical protein DER45DRAFT_258825 [Fusarium avenaceum]|nr:hypothetical protein DER45DRAFT_258825 [Fusarium avenaceum]